MAKFLNTSATNYFLEELIKDARDRVILISPFLKLNDRIKELLSDKNRLKIDVRMVYGKSELQPEEINWLNDLTFVRTSFCKNLHAKCYLNEDMCIITSLNLYEFSQVNNNEMGILLTREDDAETFREAYEEAQRIIRISDEVRVSLKKIPKEDEKTESKKNDDKPEKLTSSKLAKKLGKNTDELMLLLCENGYLEDKDGKHFITEKGKSSGGQFMPKGRFGPYFLWPAELEL
ncbi:phospholipase D family protein [Gilvimarinus xylanilyticus]|uniref:Phospholipase D family protein n=1 Tax=Gilvimarinus xylanilyticus TaxID=2944139 RepID=A0A9X2HV89_9GAMM|nr:phospholipase D family protein [Gilvimarinus xylanilyticus]MCP8899058.1 phospholipase D family protein [Gilvimarinus xylanilyticus]